VLHDSHEQSRVDELTQLPNRRAFFEQLDARLGAPLIDHAVMIVDLDGFKDVNDTFGHQAGDDLLRLVAGRLRRRLPEHVHFARLGGDEFAAVAPVGDAEEAASIGLTITRALTEPFALEAATVKVGASCGVSLQGVHGTGRSELLHAADVAMYEAKRGRHGVLIYDPARDPNSPQRQALLEDLKVALAEDRLRAWYQPIVRISDGALCGLEALARWDHPTLGILEPERFLPVVEQANLGTQLTRTMLEQAVAFAAGLYRQGLPLVVNVNISINDLLDDALAEVVSELLVTYSLPAQLLTLEITEHALVSERERAERCLSSLAARGVGIAVDDFGTGRQPLTDLARLRVHELKLHRSLVSPLGKDSSALVVVESLTHLARRLGITLVGTGVEDQAALGVLASLGCTNAQGFLISRPLDPHSLLRHLARYFRPDQAAPPPPRASVLPAQLTSAPTAELAAAQTVVTLPG
jgi:diguanylate cyclase (GGDEF)-like protein